MFWRHPFSIGLALSLFLGGCQAQDKAVQTNLRCAWVYKFKFRLSPQFSDSAGGGGLYSMGAFAGEQFGGRSPLWQ